MRPKRCEISLGAESREPRHFSFHSFQAHCWCWQLAPTGSLSISLSKCEKFGLSFLIADYASIGATLVYVLASVRRHRCRSMYACVYMCVIRQFFPSLLVMDQINTTSFYIILQGPNLIQLSPIPSQKVLVVFRHTNGTEHTLSHLPSLMLLIMKLQSVVICHCLGTAYVRRTSCPIFVVGYRTEFRKCTQMGSVHTNTTQNITYTIFGAWILCFAPTVDSSTANCRHTIQNSRSLHTTRKHSHNADRTKHKDQITQLRQLFFLCVSLPLLPSLFSLTHSTAFAFSVAFYSFRISSGSFPFVSNHFHHIYLRVLRIHTQT